MYNVLIRPLVETDALLSWKWRNDPEVWQYTGRKPDQYVTCEIEKVWIEKVLLDSTSRRFAILVNDEYVGNIQLTNIEKNKTAEYHIFIGNKIFWRKNIAFLATLQIIRFAKTILNLEEIYLNVNPNNIPAIKVYEKCNFIQVDDNIKMVLNLSEKRLPKVSVFMMVYNHEKFIKEALNGVLMQKCNFDYEIVIGEDYSTDESRNIILKYSKQFPGKFKLLLHKSNIGAQKNQLAVLENCTGQYIAMCEGDDYWTDPLKLQKQVDFLEANEEYTIVWSKYNKVDFKGDLIEKNIPVFDKSLADVTVDNFFENYRTWTLTCVFRTSVFEKYDFSKFKHSKDNTLFFAAIHNSKGRVLDFNSACYRIHDHGIWSSSTKINRYFSDFNNYNEIKNAIVYTSSLDLIVKKNLKDIVQSLIGHENSKMIDLSVYNKVFFPVMIKLSVIDKMKFLKWYFIKWYFFLIIAILKE